MIKLYLNGHQAVLFPDTKIGITAMNPYFNEINAFSYPFTIPYKPNAEILNHAARIQNVTRSFRWDAILIVDGIQLMVGDAVALGDVDNGEFPITLQSSKTSFAKIAESKKLMDLEFGTENTDNMTSDNVLSMRTYTLNSHYPECNYVCAPFFNNKAFTDTEGTWKLPDYINGYNPVTGLLINVVGNQSNVITYSFYVRYILKRIIELLGLTLADDDMATIPDLSKWFLLSLNNMWGAYNSNYKYAFNQMNVRDFLKIIRQFGIVIVTNDQLKTASVKLVRDIINSQSISHLLNDHALKDIPVMTIPADGYTVSYKDATADILLSPIIESPIFTSIRAKILVSVANYAEIPEATLLTQEYIYHTVSTDSYFVTILQPKENTNDPDVFAWENTGKYQPFISGGGEGENEIEITIVGQRLETRSVTQSIQVNDYTGNHVITKTWDVDIEMPEINQKMNNFIDIWFNGGKYEDPPIAFLFNWGLKVYTNQDDARIAVRYPVISGDAYDRAEIAKGTISMRTIGERSIIAQLVKDEADWKIRRKQKRQYFRLSVTDYTNFNWAEKQNIASVNYLVNSLKFDITPSGISLVESELFTV